MGTSMSSSNKSLKPSGPSELELGSLPEAKQAEFRRLRNLVQTGEDVRSVFEALNASPDLVCVVGNGYTLLHCACRNEEVEDVHLLEMIQFLVERFPMGLQRKNDLDMLPLHYSCKNESFSLEVLQFLVKEYL